VLRLIIKGITLNAIPVPLIATIAEVFSKHYSHTEIDSRFFAAGFPANVPTGNKQQKCHAWLLQANQHSSNPLSLVGTLLMDLMESPSVSSWSNVDLVEPYRVQIRTQLGAHGLAYQVGGHILQLGMTATSKTLHDIIRERDLKGVHQEFDRINANVETDPPAAVTAACALIEALFKTFIADQGLTMPADQSVLPLWKTVRTHLKLDPAEVQDDGLKTILSGLASIVHGIASLRSNLGSAHGHDGRSTMRVEPRHARLASNSALTLATFVIEVVDARKYRQ
jgi:hypothetical protein